MRRIDPRLRQVVIKACANSYPATKVLGMFEKFIVNTFAEKKMIEIEVDWWIDLLLECPAVTMTSKKVDGSSVLTAQFFFDAESSNAGFHRLLLHAVSQFHGLTAVSRMLEVCIDSRSMNVRSLAVSGSIDDTEAIYYLLDHVGS